MPQLKEPDHSVLSSGREFYDHDYHFAQDSDAPNPERHWHALRLIEPLAGTTFLDLGCGVGAATRLAVSRGKVGYAVGVDFSHTALQLAAQNGVQQGIDSISWILGDGTRLPFPDTSFDRVFAFGSMEHFPDVREGFAELARVLRPTGIAASVVPNFYVRTEQPLERRETMKGWRQLITSVGLDVVRIDSDVGPVPAPTTNLVRQVARVAARAVRKLPQFYYQFIFVVRKPR